MARGRKPIPERQSVPEEIGVDGWPIGRDEVAVEEAYQRGREDSLQRRLSACGEAVAKDGYGPAAMEALKLCIDNKRPLPPWLAKEVWASMVGVYNKPANRKRFEAMTAQRAREFGRWDAFHELRERKDGLGRTREDAWANVAEQEGVSFDTARGSHKKVQKALKSGQGHKYLVANFALAQPKTGVKKAPKKR